MQLQIIQNNYLYVPRFITSENALSLSKEFKDYCIKFNLQGDPQAPNSYSMYDFMPFLRLLVEKVPEVSELLGEKVLPTYTYDVYIKRVQNCFAIETDPLVKLVLRLIFQKIKIGLFIFSVLTSQRRLLN